MINKNKLLEIFVTNGLLDESKIGEIIAGSEEFNLSIDQFMIQRGYITEKDFLQVFADEFGFRLVEKIDPSLVPESFCRKVPINFSRNYNLIAIGMEGNIYQIATCTHF